MKFDDSQAIYLQIADYMGEQIIAGAWPAGERIPSVREIAGQLKVNVNTVMRAYGFMQDQNIIFNQRGIGFFAHEQARLRVMEFKKQRFEMRDLPLVFRQAQILGITPETLALSYQHYLENES